MKDQFRILIQSRKSYNGFLKMLSLEQLNEVPNGFRNNIIWNIGHIIATHQGLCYGLSGLPLNVKDEFIKNYSKGSIGNRIVSQEEVLKIKGLLRSTCDDVINDYKNGKFKVYKDYETSFGLTLDSIESAISFSNYHEGIHLGYILAQIKSLKTNS